MKHYSKPNIEVTKVEIENALLAGSVTTNDSGKVESVSGGDNFSGTSNDVLGGESGSTWDD